MKTKLILFMLAFFVSGTLMAQQKSTLNVKDLNSSIEKYVKKNYEGYKISEAYKYDKVYEMTIQKGADIESLIFDKNEKFLYKKTDANKSNFSMQMRTTMALKDVESDITKYIKKNFAEHKLTEAFKYDEVFTTKILKGSESKTLVFDDDGKFIMVAPEAKPAEQPQKKDSVHAKPVQKTDSLKTDSIKH